MSVNMDLNLVRFNLKLLFEMEERINECPLWKSCSGDSGKPQCILCKHNVLSTEEIISCMED